MPVLAALLFAIAAAAPVLGAEPDATRREPMKVTIDWGGAPPSAAAAIPAAMRTPAMPDLRLKTAPYRHGEGLGYRPQFRPRQAGDHRIGSQLRRDWRSTNGIEYSWRTFERTGKSMLGGYDSTIRFGGNIRYGTGAGYGFKK